MSTQSNPYAAPAVAVVLDTPPELATGEHEAFRRAHLAAEATVRSVGALAYLSFAVMVISAGYQLMGPNPLSGPLRSLLVFSVFFGAAMFYAGWNLRRLLPRGRLAYTLVVALNVIVMVSTGLTGGAGIGMGVLFTLLLWTRKATVVFSDHYRDVVVPATPHLKYRSPLWVRVVIYGFLGLVVLGVLFSIVLGVMGKH